MVTYGDLWGALGSYEAHSDVCGPMGADWDLRVPMATFGDLRGCMVFLHAIQGFAPPTSYVVGSRRYP